MKKLTRFIAGFSAAAALLLGVGCTNQADYVEDNTARNACNIEGLYVEGLDKAYDGNVFELHAVVVNEKGEAKSITEASDGKVTDDTVAILTGTVADSYTKDSKTVGHKSGTIYKTSADNKRLFDGDSMAVAYQRSQIAAGKTGTDIKTFAAGTLEFYLKVGNDYVFGTKKNSAGNIVPLTQKLSIPTSPAGTSDAALQSRWVKVVIANGVPTATLEKKVDEPVNVTLAHIQMDLRNVENESDLPTGVTCKVSDSDATDATKYTLKITGLESNAGTVLVLSGAAIGETAAEAKTNAADTNLFSYNKNSSVFKQTISEKGEVEWIFYGAKSPWREFYTEICISDYNNGEGDQNSNNRLLDNLNSLDGGAYPKNANFVFPKYAWNKSEVTLTIDRSKLDSTSVTQADPVVAAAEIKINAIYVANLANATETSKYYLTASDDPTSSRKFLANEKNGTLKELLEKWSPADAAAFACAEKALAYTFAETVNVNPGQSTFVLGFRAVPPKATDADSYDWDNNVAFETPTLLTESYADGKEYTLYADAVTGVINLIETSKVNFGAFPLNISKVYLKGFADDVPGDSEVANPVKPTLVGNFNNWGLFLM